MAKILIYGETPACKKLRDGLKQAGNTVVLCHPDFFEKGDLSDAHEVYFPEAHPSFAKVMKIASVPFALDSGRAGEVVAVHPTPVDAVPGKAK